MLRFREGQLLLEFMHLMRPGYFNRGKLCSALAGLLLLLFPAGCAHPGPPVSAPQQNAQTVQTAPAPKPVAFAEWPDSVVYFVIVDRFADGDLTNDAKVDTTAKGTFHGGDLKGLTKEIDQIASLGVTALWITPVVKNIDGFVMGAGFPDWGYHGYWADDFYKTDPRFGSEADLKALVDEAHKRGIRVLLDVVYNHAGYDSHYLTDPKTKGWLRSNERGDCGSDDITSCVAGLPDFKTELPEVRDYLMTANLGLAKRTGVDGFRLDTVKHVTHDFWQEHRKRARAELGDKFFLLGEVWGGDSQVLDPWFAGDEMDAGFDFSFQGSALGWVQGRGRTIAFDKYLRMREKIRPGYLVSQFLSSHDVPGALWQLKGDKELFRLAAILEFTSVGIPMVYYGEEVGRMGGDWPDNRSDMPWSNLGIKPGAGAPRDEALRTDYRKLIAIRRANPALSRGAHTALSTDGDLLVFMQRDAASKNVVVVALNRGADEAQATFDAPEEWGEHDVEDAWSGQAFKIVDKRVNAAIPPRGARIFVTPDSNRP